MNTIASYRDILVNGVKCDEVLTTTKEVYVPKIINGVSSRHSRGLKTNGTLDQLCGTTSIRGV